ncbi:MAG: hypothetical protein ACI9DF_004646 [Verrucomicrobiales bacterium]|jgi:hypothetical protein
MALAGVEGPCPFCTQPIAAPVPAQGLPARHLVPQAAPVPAPPPPPTPPLPEPVPVVPLPASRNVLCSACGCELAIDASMAHLPGGPCPRCQTWIDLQGNALAPAQAAPNQEPPPVVASPKPSNRRSSPSSKFGNANPAAPSEMNQSAAAADVGGLNFPKMESAEPAVMPDEESSDPPMERRRVKYRKKRRQLPPEFYVGHAARDLDAKGQETTGRMRREQFPKEGESVRGRKKETPNSTEGGDESKVVRLLPVVFGILLALIIGLFTALHFEWINPADLHFWESKTDQSDNRNGFDSLARSIEQTDQDLKGKAKEAYQEIDKAIEGFLSAETWDEASSMVTMDNVPEDSSTLSFLKMFPRESYRGSEVKVIHYSRIPKTERFVFTTHLSNGLGDNGDELLTFMIGEQIETGPPKIHGLQLYQSWKRTLSEFLETSGASAGRFYGELRVVNERASPTTLTFPDDGPYVKLELRDLLVKEPWTKEVYVRKDSWAGKRSLNTLSESWSKAILDLEWLQGPTGDAFVHVGSVQSSNWGDFPK